LRPGKPAQRGAQPVSPSSAPRWAASGLALLIGLGLSVAGHAGVGDDLFRRGVLPGGAPVRATHSENGTLEGAPAACASCHRRSGLGSIEGRFAIPPIAGPYLFTPRGTSLEKSGTPFIDTERVNHEAYTDTSLARAIREGIGSNGKSLNYLMPRYPLDDATMAALIAYLRDLKVTAAPGVTSTVLHFATIITPDADPVERRGMLEVMNKYFADKNVPVARTKAPVQYSSHAMMFRVERRWQLHVWELSGAADTWKEQLRRHLAAEPVFAVVSGLGGSNWEPVQRFCEEERLPCLFPNVEAPAGKDSDYYTMYFSRGVLLEAHLIAGELAQPEHPLTGLVQIYRAGDVGERAARALHLARPGVPILERRLSAHGGAAELRSALRGLKAGEGVVLWLRPDDVRALPELPTGVSHVWISGEMAGLEQAPLPPSWRGVTRMSYPVDLPERRVVRVDYALSWFRLRQVQLLSPRVQVDTYLACGLLSETINHIVDAFVRDYLIERLEMLLDHRALTGYYPRLTLAPGQRFASKGGFMVRFADAQGPKVTPLSDWVTP
jgi:hypothetical protein